MTIYDSDFVWMLGLGMGLIALLGLALWASEREPSGLPPTWDDDSERLG